MNKKIMTTALVGTALVGSVAIAPVAFADGPVSASVAHTEGQTLLVRSGPGTGHGVLAQLAEGDVVDIDCQVDGEVVEGNVVWDYLPAYGGYASDHYLYTEGSNGRHPDLSECDGAEPPPAEGLRDEIVSIASGELGNTDGASYHPGQGDPSDAWCQYFVNWVWRTAGVPDMFSANGFTGDFYWWAADRGLLREGTGGIRAGDAVLFGTGPSDPSTSLHVGIVVAVHADGSITSVDGNYDNAVAEVGPYWPGDATTHEPGNVYAVVSPE